MRYLLINAPIRLRARPNNIPYGLATVAAVLRDCGHEVEIYDVNGLRHDREQVLSEIRRRADERPWDVVAMSGLLTTIEFQSWLAPHIKAANPDAPLVLGGGLPTCVPGLCCADMPADILVLGEGEATIAELAHALAEGRDLHAVAGLALPDDSAPEGFVTTAPRAPIADLDTVPFPAWDLLPVENYLINPIWGGGANNSSGMLDGVETKCSMNVISSRGCPFACNYCYHLFGRGKYRFRSAANVMAEIHELVERYGVDFIGFVDDNMVADEARLLEFCDLLEQSGLDIRWGCHGRVTSAKYDVLRRMVDAGCVWLGFGIESGSAQMLTHMNKKATPQMAAHAITECRRAGLFPNSTFIFGYPGETRETIQESLEFKRALGIEAPSFFATPYPGTPLYRQVLPRILERFGSERAFIYALGNATDFVINLTDFSDEELFELKERYDANEDVILQKQVVGNEV